MNAEKFKNEIERRKYIIDTMQPDILSMFSRQQGDKLKLLKLTELWSIKNEVLKRK
jgi:hypothetical protein